MPREFDLAKRKIWRRRLREFERGNESIVEFCRRAGVPVWSFYYWRRRVQHEGIGTTSQRQRHGTRSPAGDARCDHRSRRGRIKPRLKFLPIEIAGRSGIEITGRSGIEVTGRPSVEVYLPNGARVTVPCYDRDAIGAVIAALVSDPKEA